MEYVTIKLPKQMIVEVETQIKENEELGYANRTQYITDSIRRRIEEHRRSRNKKNSKEPNDPNQTKIPIKDIFNKKSKKTKSGVSS